MAGEYVLYGHIGSPYSMKMRSILRYRRIPHTFVEDGIALTRVQQEVKVPVIPVLADPEGRLQNDSTVLIFELEKRHSDRSILPERESDAFLAQLIEDLADEWLTKSMYFYRWFHPEYRKATSEAIAFDMFFGGGREKLEGWAETFRSRQADRLDLVGCTEENRPLIERIAEDFLDILESHVVDTPFLFGSRPSLADFGLFGQLSQFVMDLSIIQPARDRAPYLMRWVHLMHDLSGLQGEWREADQPLHPAVEHLMGIAGRDYLPFLQANAEAFRDGIGEVRHESAGLTYRQAPYKYQVKCLQNLRSAYAQLSDRSRKEIDPILERTECQRYLLSMKT